MNSDALDNQLHHIIGGGTSATKLFEQNKEKNQTVSGKGTGNTQRPRTGETCTGQQVNPVSESVGFDSFLDQVVEKIRRFDGQRFCPMALANICPAAVPFDALDVARDVWIQD